MSEEPQATGQQQPSQEGPQFALQRVYVKDISFETPNSPQIFLEQWQPDMNLNLNTQARELGEDNYEVTLMVTVTVKVKEKTAFLVEVHQAGIFVIKGVPQEQMGPVVGITCANILFPYARATVSDLIMRGSFPQLALQPINFEAVYAQQVQQAQENAAQTGGDTAH
jgi:preprotein translocase subunit SecB